MDDIFRGVGGRGLVIEGRELDLGGERKYVKPAAKGRGSASVPGSLGKEARVSSAKVPSILSKKVRSTVRATSDQDCYRKLKM